MAGSPLEMALARVQPALAAWRQQRRHREAIPDDLWRLIVPLAQAHGVSPVAQGLGKLAAGEAAFRAFVFTFHQT